MLSISEAWILMANENEQRFSALRRKADALEESGGDPAKVAELRAQAPIARSEKPMVTAEQPDKEKAEAKTEPVSKPADDKPKASDSPKAEKPVAAKPGPGRPRLAATRGENK
jgi:Ulp1 family protease